METELLLATLYGTIERAVSADDLSILERNREARIDHLERSLIVE